jgi:hypothetical protein
MIAAREWSPAKHETEGWGGIEIEEVISFFCLLHFSGKCKGFFYATDL